MLRAPSYRETEDETLGEFKDSEISIQILSYSGAGVSTGIGLAFQSLAADHGFTSGDCRLIAKTRNSCSKANGGALVDTGASDCMRLADAAMRFQHSSSALEKIKAVTDAHKISLSIAGKLQDRTYNQAIVDLELEELAWRGQFVKILESLKFDANADNNRNEWIERARSQFNPFLPAGGRTISQLLRNEARLDQVLGMGSSTELPSRTIHEVKGKEYPAVCVVLTTASLNSILTHLEEEPDSTWSEEARALYVAASRAKQLLVFACPKSQSKRMKAHLESSGAVVELTDI